METSQALKTENKQIWKYTPLTVRLFLDKNTEYLFRIVLLATLKHEMHAVLRVSS
jgi:hypothetical protein